MKRVKLFSYLVLFFIVCFVSVSSASDFPIVQSSIFSSNEQTEPYLIDIARYPQNLAFQELIQSESNIPRKSYMPINFVGYLTKKEFDLSARGCEQRTQALLMFLIDIYSGKKNVIKDNIIPEEVAEYALRTQGFPELVGKLTSETIAITNGSDINLKRNKDGKIVVIEDNIGSLGGREEIYAIVDIFARSFKNVKVFDPYVLERKYIYEMTKWFSHFPGKYVIYCSDIMRPEETFAPQRKNLNNMGIYFANQDDLYVKDNKLFLKPSPLNDKDVEVSILEHNGLDFTLDLEYPLFQKRCDLLDLPKDSIQDIPGIMRVFLAGNIILGHSPGSSLADSKIVYPFVENLIRYYLNEEPILASAKTYGLKVNDVSLHEIPYSLSFEEAVQRKNELVLKPIRGECGIGVFVGKYLDEKKWKEELTEVYSTNPEDFLFFQYVEILEEYDYLLSHRLFVDAYQDNVSTRPGAYLRMKTVNGDGVISTGNDGTIATATLIEGLTTDESLLLEL